MIAIIVATDKNGAIGAENKIPWRIKSDLMRLSSTTRGHPVIVGRKTYDSMVWYYNRSGRDMPGSCYIVVTRNHDYKPTRPNARTVHSFADALATAKSLGDDAIYVIGGGAIFKEALPHTDRVYLTQVQTNVTNAIDAYFPKLNPSEWRETSRTHYTKNDHDQFDTEVLVLDRT